MTTEQSDRLLAEFESIDTWNQFVDGTDAGNLAARGLTCLRDLLRPCLIAALWIAREAR